MFCSKCGSQIDENINFCAKCGAPVKKKTVKSVAEASTAVEPTKPLETNAPVAPQAIYQSPLSDKGAELKASFGSVFAIFAVVSYIVVFILGVMGAINASRPDMVKMFEKIGIDELDREIRNLCNIGTDFFVPVIGIIAQIPILLILIGLIYNLIQAYSKKAFSNVGMGFVKAGAVLKIIFAALVLLVAVALVAGRSFVHDICTEIILEFEIDGIKFSEAKKEITKIINGFESTLYIGIILVAVWQVFVIVYNAFVLGGVGNIKKTMSEEKESKGLSLLCVASYVMAALNIIKVAVVYLVSSNTGLMMGGIDSTDLFSNRDLREFEKWLFGWCEPNTFYLAAGIVLSVTLILFCINITVCAKKQTLVKN